jgi:hypothetical protein
MTGRSLYDQDILLWSEQQAAALRRLGETRPNLPNELDIENIAEEIESLGRSELAAVKSQLRLMLSHLIKLSAEPESDAARHWHVEVFGFHRELHDRYAPSMRQRIELVDIWRSASKQARLAYQGTAQQQAVADLPVDCPFTLDDLLIDEIDSFLLVERIRQSADANVNERLRPDVS